MMSRTHENPDAFDEDDMPCPCSECGLWFDLLEGLHHPKQENVLICEVCADRIQEEVDREEEIDELLEEIRSAEYTLNSVTKSLMDNYGLSKEEIKKRLKND